MTTSGSRREAYESSTSGRISGATAMFAGILLATTSIFQILEGIAAIAKDAVYATGIDYTYELDVTAWGWIHIIIGAIGLLVGIGVLMGQTWGQVMGLLIAFFGTLTNFAFLPQYPWWSIMVIAFNVLVMWALCGQLSGGSGYAVGDARSAGRLDKVQIDMNRAR